MPAAAPPRRTRLALWAGLLALTVLAGAAAQAQDEPLSVTPVRTPDSLAAGASTAIVFEVATAGDALDVVERLDVPTGWTVMPPPGAFGVPAGGAVRRILAVRAPDGATAGVYPLRYAVAGGGHTAATEWSVTVPEVREVDVVPVDVVDLSAAGTRLVTTFRVVNTGNAAVEVEAVVSSPFPFAVEPARFALAPRESREVEVEEQVSAALAERTRRVLRFEARIPGDVGRLASASVRGDLIPLATARGLSYDTFPLLVTTRGRFQQYGEFQRASAAVDVRGAGPVWGATELGVQARFPEVAVLGDPLNSRGQYQASLAGPAYRVAVGDGVGQFSSNPWVGLNGFGAHGEVTRGVWRGAAFGGVDRYGGLFGRDYVGAETGLVWGERVQVGTGLTYVEGLESGLVHRVTGAASAGSWYADADGAWAATGGRGGRLSLGGGGPALSLRAGGAATTGGFFGIAQERRSADASVTSAPTSGLRLNTGISYYGTEFRDAVSAQAGVSALGVRLRGRIERSETDGLGTRPSGTTELRAVTAGTGVRYRAFRLNAEGTAGERYTNVDGVVSEQFAYGAGLRAEVRVGRALSLQASASHDEGASSLVGLVESRSQTNAALGATVEVGRTSGTLAARVNRYETPTLATEVGSVDLRVGHVFGNDARLDLLGRGSLTRSERSDLDVSRWTASVQASLSIPLNVPIRRRRDVGLVSGRLTDAESGALAGVPVFVAERAAVTDDDGRFWIGDVPTGRHVYAVHQPSLGFDRVLVADSSVVTVEGGAETVLTLHALRGATVAGRVVGPDPDAVRAVLDEGPAPTVPVAGVAVEVTGGGKTWHRLTSSDGTFAVRGVPPGEYAVRVIGDVPDNTTAPAAAVVSPDYGERVAVALELREARRRIRFVDPVAGGGAGRPVAGSPTSDADRR